MTRSPEHCAAISAGMLAVIVPGKRRTPERDGDVRQANDRIANLIRRGILAHPSTLPCTDCGQVWAEGLSRHEYDHHLGYGVGHHEDVEPVCSACHHARERARGRVRKPEFPCPLGEGHTPYCKPCATAHARRYRAAKKALR